MPSVIEILQIVASVLACGLIPFAMTGYPCCCTAGEQNCTACILAQASNEYSVSVSGAANDNCTACSNWDGTYVCVYSVDCTYIYSSTGSDATSLNIYFGGFGCLSCDFLQVRVTLIDGGATYAVGVSLTMRRTVGLSQHAETYSFQTATQGTTLDCLNFSALSIPYTSRSELGSPDGTYGCDLSGATVTVTSV